MQNENKKLAIFDIDGTIATNGSVVPEILEGIKNLQSLGYYTTVCTGRNYVGVRQALGDKFDEVISSGVLIGVEGGSKVVDKQGNVVYADYLNDKELEHIVDFIKSNIHLIKYLWFFNSDPNMDRQTWCKNEEMIDEVKQKRIKFGEAPNVFRSSFEELLQKLKAEPLTVIATRLESHIKVENLKLHLTRSDVAVLFLDGGMEFLRNTSDKGRSISKMEGILKISKNNILVAGNAINDVEMLNIPAGLRILVGTDENTNNILMHLDDKHNVIRLDSPEHLGEFLQNLKD